MSKLPAKPRLIGATVLSLLALIAIAAILPATGHAAPPSSGFPLAATSSVFAKTTVGSGSEKLPVELTNVSGEAVLVTGFSLEGPDAGDFVVNEFPCGMLAPGASCTAGLYFYPHRVGEEHATLRLDLYNQPTEYVELSGTGVPPELSFSPPSYDFGLQRVNRESVSTSLQVENSGEAAVQINNFEIAGPGSSAFWTGSSSCWGTWLAPGQACSMEVSFGPRERTAYEAQLRAWVNGEAFGADLRGQGGRAVVEASENPLEFGTATAGSAGAVRTLTLTNTGDLPESFFIGVVAGGSAASFKLLDENCTAAPLGPQSSCTARVRFTPDSPGVKAARLAFFGDGDGGMMIQLTGEGVAAALTLSPGSFDFGSQAREATSSARSFGVRNGGSTPVALGAAAIVGANLDQFLLAGDECSGVPLGPGEECLVRIRFAPATVGTKTATLRIGSDGGALTAALSGTGVAPEKGASAGDSRSRPLRSHFRRGVSLSAAKARCPAHRRCGKAGSAQRARSRG